jgi:hypothetical protein
MSQKGSEEIIQLQNKIKELEEKLSLKDKLVFMLEESIPKEATARKKYVGDVALFYQSVFKDKLKHFIGEQLLELALIGRTEPMNDIFRSNINCFRIMDEWMQSKTNEYIGDVEEIRKSAENNKDFINNLKKTYED